MNKKPAAPSQPLVFSRDGVRGPLTDAQRDECRHLYNNLKHLESAGYHTADDVIRKAAVYGYMNGHHDFASPVAAPEAPVEQQDESDEEIIVPADMTEAEYWKCRARASAAMVRIFKNQAEELREAASPAATTASASGDAVNAIVRDVCELDYTDGFDEEKIMSVTLDDLRLICERSIAAMDRAPAPLDEALRKINDIRNSIIGIHALNWSEHVYPLVAALDAAGYEGMDCPEARKYYGTMLERAIKAEDALAALTTSATGCDAALRAYVAFAQTRRAELGELSDEIEAVDTQARAALAEFAALANNNQKDEA